MKLPILILLPALLLAETPTPKLTEAQQKEWHKRIARELAAQVELTNRQKELTQLQASYFQFCQAAKLMLALDESGDPQCKEPDKPKEESKQ